MLLLLTLALYNVHNIACKPCSIEIVRPAAQLDKAVAPLEQLGCDLLSLRLQSWWFDKICQGLPLLLVYTSSVLWLCRSCGSLCCSSSSFHMHITGLHITAFCYCP